MTTLTRQDLAAMGMEVQNGKAVRRITPAATALAELRAADRFRSKWDRERNDYLETMMFARRLRRFRYEPMRLRLADGSWYKPDFLVEHNDGRLELEEVKGYRREAAIVRFKVARELYPMFTFTMITKRNGQWVSAL